MANFKPSLSRKWLVLTAAFLCRMLSGGYCVSMGVYLFEFVESFDSGRGPTGWVISIAGGLMYGAGIPVSFLLYKTSIRTCCTAGAVITSAGLCVSYFADSIAFLIISFGITTGIGMCCVLSSCAAAVSHMFSKGKGAAIAVLESGLTIGGSLLPILLRFLIDTYGWRGAVLISAAILLNILPMSVLLGSSSARRVKPKENECEKSQSEHSPGYCNSGFYKKKLFIVYIFVSVVVAIGNAYVYAVIVDMGNLRGYGKIKSTYLVTVLSVSNILGVAIMAMLLKIFYNGAAWLFILNILVMSASMCVFPITSSYVTLVLASVLYGITAGGLYGTYIAVTTTLLDPGQYALGTGITCSAYGLGTALSTPVAGWLKDLTGDYKNSFYVGGLLCFGAVFFLAISIVVNAFWKKAEYNDRTSTSIEVMHNGNK